MAIEFATSAAEVTALTDEAVAEADRLLDGIRSTTSHTWDTVMAPLDRIGDVLVRADGRGGFLGYVHPDPELRTAAKDAEQRLQQWAVAMVFDEGLYAAVSAYARTDEAAALTGERARFLEFVQRDLRRAGHELSSEDRAELERLSQRLVEISVTFQRNVDEWEDALVVTREDLEGMPDAYVESLSQGPSDGTYRVTMAYPDVIPFMDLSPRRDLRRELDRRFNTRAEEANRPLLKEALELRARIAELFGQPSWSHHQLEERMAGHPDAVEQMYADLLTPLTEAGQAELAVMQQLLAEDTGDPDVVVQRWDWRYYHARIEREQHGIDQNEVAQYFPLEAVLDGMLELCGDVFGLDHVPVELDVWHPDVRSFEVRDRSSGEFIAHVHMDLFPREGTYGHAAAFTLVPGRLLDDGSYQHPTSAIVANFTKPVGERPSLLQHQEVETLFHEYGHILHQVLTRAELARFSGTSVQRDFVEAPSQIMEHWTWQPSVLRRFARHHETGEPIPTELIDALVAARNLDVALTTLRQVHFGVLDMTFHGPGGATVDLDEATRKATELTLLPHPPDTFFPGTFSHIIGGYDAGYYGYLWSDVIGDDMFRRFQEEGILSSEVGADYRRIILESGGTRDAGELVREFTGREPDNTAFLAKLGIG